MTQEDKHLLLTDLCARLPYGVIIQEYNEEYGYADNVLNTIGIGYFSIHEASVEGTWINHIENVKPYLRPMSSMTEEEDKEMQMVLGGGEYADLINRTSGLELWLESVDTDPTIWFDSLVDVQDWLNAHYFDYRGLIEKGLAIEAPKGMYDIKEK